ncbi:hypothetical protein EI94DRAFT_1815139 [Lactarius quietus]|nr:hypothetical protein EI94DRAFT_1815139 [Lactarius quietus]
MPCIIEDPNRAVCPNFGGPQWDFLRQSMIGANQGDQPLTHEEATQQMKDVWTSKRERVALKEEDTLHAQHEREAEELRKEAEKKKPKLTIFDWSRASPGWIEPRLVQYALNKLDNLEYVELDYFMIKGCREVVTDERNMVGDDSLGLAQHGDAIALRPLAAQRPTRRVRKDEDLSWGEMLDAKNMMLHFMEKSGVWPALHAEAISGFFLNLELHPRAMQPNGNVTCELHVSLT